MIERGASTFSVRVLIIKVTIYIYINKIIVYPEKKAKKMRLTLDL